MKKPKVIQVTYRKVKQPDGFFRVLKVTYNTETGVESRRKVGKDLTDSDAENLLYQVERGIVRLNK